MLINSGFYHFLLKHTFSFSFFFGGGRVGMSLIVKLTDMNFCLPSHGETKPLLNLFCVDDWKDFSTHEFLAPMFLTLFLLHYSETSHMSCLGRFVIQSLYLKS